jgi:hypothetical protein
MTRPMSIQAAVVWAIVTVLIWLFFSIPAQTIPVEAPVYQFICVFCAQLLAMVTAVVLLRRTYAPGVPVREFVGIRMTHPGFYLLALGLAFSLQVTAGVLYDAIVTKYPTSTEGARRLTQLFTRESAPGQLVLGSIIVALGPFLEEIFYRGALFLPLHKGHRANVAIFVTSLLFAAAHLEWQIVLPLATVGLAMGLIRSASGSLLPAIVLHAAFNGTTLLAGSVSDPAAPGDPPQVPVMLIVMAPLITLSLLGLAYALGQKSALARNARVKDDR